MLHVTEILGDVSEPRYETRAREIVQVSSADAPKRRLRLATGSGVDLAVDLPRGSYLHHGAVLADTGDRIVVVERAPEPALVVSLPRDLSVSELVEAAARIGHAFGNQHVPLDVTGGEILVPITTSPAIAEQTVRDLGIDGLETRIEAVRLGSRRPLGASPHGHAHGH